MAILFLFGTVSAQQLIYKGPKPKKELSKAKTEGQPLTKLDMKEYVYDPRGKTDPFKSFIAEEEEIAEKERRKPRTYLETLDLTQLELIAIVVGAKERWAMVRDAKGIGYVIRKGTAIGLYEGVVYDIQEEKVVVHEKFRDYKGRKKTRVVEKELLKIE